MHQGEAEDMKLDGVLVVGSGPLGSTYARILVDNGIKVKMIDIGAQLSPDPGTHLKNSAFFQKEINQFVGVVQGHLQPISIPADQSSMLDMDPYSFHFDVKKYKGYTQGGQNPDQDPYYNLPDAAACYAVGGMGTHWTCCTPREHAKERSELIPDEDWDKLYCYAEKLLKTNNTVFEDSIRNTVVREALQQIYPDLKDPKTRPQNLPLACVANYDKKCAHDDETQTKYIKWSGADTILGEKILQMVKSQKTDEFELCPEWQCWKLEPCEHDNGVIKYASIQDLKNNKHYKCYAKAFVIACNATLTPQLLYNSNIRPPALGKYISEQTMTFCQIVLGQDLIKKIETDDRFKKEVDKHKKDYPYDPVPIPLNDLTPQCWIPVSSNRDWHCQVNRDAYSYGKLPPNVDTRLIVDLRSFGIVEPRKCNYISFSDKYKDAFGMPQPTYHFELSNKDAKRAHDMMSDMLKQANALGGFLPGMEPKFLNPGGALHITGSVRMGRNIKDSVVDTNCCVWGYKNLYLGTCGVIPTGTACNPTLTAMALAIRGARAIVENFQENKF